MAALMLQLLRDIAKNASAKQSYLGSTAVEAALSLERAHDKA